MVDVDDFISMRAGELKKALHIALPDCYVIATAEKVDAIPLFKRIEKGDETRIRDPKEAGSQVSGSNLEHNFNQICQWITAPFDSKRFIGYGDDDK